MGLAKSVAKGAVCVAGAVGLVGGIGYGFDHVEITKNSEAGYKKRDDWHISPSLFGITIYASPTAFAAHERTNAAGSPITPNPELTYKPNTVIGQDVAALVASKLALKGMVCPDDPDTVPYYPNAKETDTTLNVTGAVDLDICIDFENTTAAGGKLRVPLMLKPEYGVESRQLNYRNKTTGCIRMAIRYAGITNGIVVDELNLNGFEVADDAVVPIVIAMNSSDPNPCDMDGVTGAIR